VQRVSALFEMVDFIVTPSADAQLAAFASAYQQATGFHKLHPKLD